MIHKTSSFKEGEVEGFEAAADDKAVDTLDLITVGSSSARFFTPRAAPPFRGTHVVLDGRSQLLYTSGSIPFYETYPGPYVPQPLAVSLQSSGGGRRHALELLALTKLNWNHSRLDGRDPITTLARAVSAPSSATCPRARRSATGTRSICESRRGATTAADGPSRTGCRRLQMRKTR